MRSEKGLIYIEDCCRRRGERMRYGLIDVFDLVCGGRFVGSWLAGGLYVGAAAEVRRLI